MNLIRKILRNFINGDYKPLVEIGLENCKIKRVWTIINEDLLYNRFNPQTGENELVGLDKAILIHLYNVFLEDIGHDWSIYRESFGFYGHSGRKGELHDLLIEYEIK